MLKRIHLFRGMDDDTLEATVDLMEQVDLPSGESIYKEEELPDYFYFILEGEVRTSRLDPQTGQVQQTRKIGRRRLFWRRSTGKRAGHGRSVQKPFPM